MAILDEIRDRKATVSIAGGIIIVALIVIWSQTRSSTLTLNRDIFIGIGQVAASETAAAVHDHGQILAVINRFYTTAGAGQPDEWKAFQRELKKHAGITLLAPVSVEEDPSDSAPGCPIGIFKNLMEQNADVDAIVFFVSLPDWQRLQAKQLIPQRLPPQVIVVDTGPSPGLYASYFANGYVSVLIASRRGAAPTKPGGPQTAREWFDQYFQVFTPANFE
jgi:hypothetical protein